MRRRRWATLIGVTCTLVISACGEADTTKPPAAPAASSAATGPSSPSSVKVAAPAPVTLSLTSPSGLRVSVTVSLRDGQRCTALQVGVLGRLRGDLPEYEKESCGAAQGNGGASVIRDSETTGGVLVAAYPGRCLPVRVGRRSDAMRPVTSSCTAGPLPLTLAALPAGGRLVLSGVGRLGRIDLDRCTSSTGDFCIDTVDGS